MIYEIKAGEKVYPFVFGFRALFALGQRMGTELDDTQKALTMDFDVMLEMYERASERGARKSGNPELVLTALEIEDLMDDDFEFAKSLNDAFSNAMKSQFASEGNTDKGKPKPKAKR